jgi:hypothetical protein
VPDIEAVLNPWAEDDLRRLQPALRLPRPGDPSSPLSASSALAEDSDERFTEHPRVYVDVFAGTADEARTLASQPP